MTFHSKYNLAASLTKACVIALTAIAFAMLAPVGHSLYAQGGTSGTDYDVARQIDETIERIRILHSQGNYELAYEAVEELLRLSPEHPIGLFYRDRIEYRLGSGDVSPPAASLEAPGLPGRTQVTPEQIAFPEPVPLEPRRSRASSRFDGLMTEENLRYGAMALGALLLLTILFILWSRRRSSSQTLPQSGSTSMAGMIGDMPTQAGTATGWNISDQPTMAQGGISDQKTKNDSPVADQKTVQDQPPTIPDSDDDIALEKTQAHGAPPPLTRSKKEEEKPAPPPKKQEPAKEFNPDESSLQLSGVYDDSDEAAESQVPSVEQTLDETFEQTAVDEFLFEEDSVVSAPDPEPAEEFTELNLDPTSIDSSPSVRKEEPAPSSRNEDTSPDSSSLAPIDISQPVGFAPESKKEEPPTKEEKPTEEPVAGDLSFNSLMFGSGGEETNAKEPESPKSKPEPPKEEKPAEPAAKQPEPEEKKPDDLTLTSFNEQYSNLMFGQGAEETSPGEKKSPYAYETNTNEEKTQVIKSGQKNEDFEATLGPLDRQNVENQEENEATLPLPNPEKIAESHGSQGISQEETMMINNKMKSPYDHSEDTRAIPPIQKTTAQAAKEAESSARERQSSLFDRQLEAGKQAFEEENYAKAVQCLSVAASLNPRDPEVKELLDQARKKRREAN